MRWKRLDENLSRKGRTEASRFGISRDDARIIIETSGSAFPGPVMVILTPRLHGRLGK
jgi:hypothetical protein